MDAKQVWQKIFPLQVGDRVKVRKASLYFPNKKHYFIHKTGTITFISKEGDRIEVELDEPVGAIKYTWFAPSDLIRLSHGHKP